MSTRKLGDPISPELIAEAAQQIENHFGLSTEKSIQLAAWALAAYEAKGGWINSLTEPIEHWLEVVISHWLEHELDSDKNAGNARENNNYVYSEPPEFTLDQPIKFIYPVLIRIILGIGGPAFLAAAIFTAPLVREQGLALWVPLLFLIIGLGSLVLVYLVSGHIVVDGQAIYYRKLGKEIIILYKEVQLIEHQPLRDRLIIQGKRGRIVVHKVLKEYVLFYYLLTQFCPGREKEAQLSFPLEVHTHRWLLIIPIFYILGSFYLLYVGIQHAFIPLYFLGPIGILISAWLFLGIPRKYVFDTGGLTKISLLRTKRFRAEDLYEVQLNRPFNQYSFTETSVVELKFETGKVIMPNIIVDFPLEVLARLLHERYPRLTYGAGSFDEEASSAWPGTGSLEFRKKKTKRIAFLIAVITFLGIGAFLFAIRTEILFQAHTYDLAVLEGYPDPGPWILLRSGSGASPETYHTWIQTNHGLFDPWIATSVAIDDPQEYYQRIDLRMAFIYGMFTVLFAAAGREGVIGAVKYWNKRVMKTD